MAEPSKQWADVPCIVRRQSSSSSSSSKLSSSSTQHNSEGEINDGGYARPSAIINVDFDKISFPNREPILGFGGAFTEAAALNFGSLNEEGRKVALELLFGRDGLGYR